MNKSKNPIPVKNLFFMLCYAWNVLSIKDTVKLDEEKFDNIYNLLTRLLIFGVRKIVKRGFNKSYVEQEEALQTVRGKIDINDTIKRRLNCEMVCVCSYDEFSRNNPFNQIVKYTMLCSLKNKNVDDKLKKELRSLLLFFHDIDSLEPTTQATSKLIFNRNNQYYKMLINICLMIYKETMVNEATGERTFKDFFREEQMQKVYELFILNFYAIHLDKSAYKVHAPKISWHLDAEETGWEDFFEIETDVGERRTDIVIENKQLKYQFIIDAKYYKEMLISKYHSDIAKTYRTSHINQVRGYILDSGYAGEKFGALMYPTVYNDKYDDGVLLPIHDAHIIMKTLDLNRDWNEIEQDLLSLVSKIDQRKRQ